MPRSTRQRFGSGSKRSFANVTDPTVVIVPPMLSTTTTSFLGMPVDAITLLTSLGVVMLAIHAARAANRMKGWFDV